MTTFFIILGTVIITVAGIVLLVLGFYYWHEDDIRREQAQIEAAMRAWAIQQQEFAAEQAIRQTTRAAVDQMLMEARQQEARRQHPSNGV